MEDARLFRDAGGDVRMMYNRHFWVNPTGKEGELRVAMYVSKVLIDPKTLNITLEGERDLIYLNQARQEKNWVPWEVRSRGISVWEEASSCEYLSLSP